LSEIGTSLNAFKEICEWLATRESFLLELQTTGGLLEVDIWLRAGGAVVGDSMDSAQLLMAAKLGIKLTIFVIPATKSALETGDQSSPKGPQLE